ncbi:MAG: tetratricopeptide repeat protein [Candidatus Omnitrophica bacterium]|nr:tetratricopeptide repeat protein [Candidatus Omnitrophota bacterium]
MIVVLTGMTLLAAGICSANETPPQAMAVNDKAAGAQTVSLYDQGIAAGQANDFQKALPLFEQALRQDPNNPDILNMLAHTQRKIGLIDEALANYKKALELRPRFPEAREYLGEAYVQAALREVEVLKSYGGDAKDELEDLTNDIKEAGQKL